MQFNINIIEMFQRDLNADVFACLSKPREVFATLKSKRRVDFDKQPALLEQYLDILFYQYQHETQVCTSFLQVTGVFFQDRRFYQIWF